MKKEFIVSIFLFFIITLCFFYPILKGHVPFPGDLLVSSFTPYNTNSYLGYTPGGVPNKAQGSDVIKEMFPWKMFVIGELKKGQMPYWTPYNFSGNPVMANFQSAVFYPGNIVFFLLPFLSAWTVFIFLAPFLAGLFTYFFLRELSLGKLSAIFGGLAFAFSSYMAVWVEYGNITHTYVWLPLALLFTNRLIKNFNKKNLLFLLLTLLVSLSAGYIQGYCYILLTVTFYYFGKSWLEKKLTIKKGSVFLFVLLAPFFLFLFQLLSTFTIFKDSSRGNYSLEQIDKLLNPIWYTITTVIPNFFGHPASRNHWFDGTYIERVSYFGLLPFIFAIASLFSFKKNKDVTCFSVLFFVTFFMATNFFINKFFYLLPIPILSTTVPTRILGLFTFCGSILAAFGLEYFLQKKNKKQLNIALISVFILLIGSFFFTIVAAKLFQSAQWTAYLAITKRNMMVPLALAGIFFVIYLANFYSSKFTKKKIISSALIGTVCIAITLLDLLYFFHKITPFSPKDFIYPQTEVVTYLQKNAGVDRFWGYGSAYIGSNFQAVDRTFSPEGEDPLHLRWYTQFIASTENGKVPTVLPRPDANIASGYGLGQFEGNIYRQKILNLTGVRYILNKDDLLGKEQKPELATFRQSNYKLVWQNAPWQVYENLQVAPRAFLTTDYHVVADETKIVEAFFKPDFDETKTIILQEDPKIKKTPLKNSSARIIHYLPNKVIVQTNSDQSALLFLSDTYSHSWQATIDGKKTSLYKANYAFRAVPITSGKHTVVFSYNSDLFKKGLLYSGVFAVFLAFFFWKLNPKKL